MVKTCKCASSFLLAKLLSYKNMFSPSIFLLVIVLRIQKVETNFKEKKVIEKAKRNLIK